MKSTLFRRPLGSIQGSFGVLCLAVLTSGAGCGAENQSSIDGAGAAAERATNGADESVHPHAVPWGPDEA